MKALFGVLMLLGILLCSTSADTASSNDLSISHHGKHNGHRAHRVYTRRRRSLDLLLPATPDEVNVIKNARFKCATERLTKLVSSPAAKQELLNLKAKVVTRFSEILKYLVSGVTAQTPPPLPRIDLNLMRDESLIHCIQWNCNGLRAQSKEVDKFLEFAILSRFDIILLNEVRANETVAEAFATMLEMNYTRVNSSAPRGALKRGSMILWNSSRVNVEDEHIKLHSGWDNDAPAIELVGINFTHADPRYADTSYRIATSYIRGKSDNNIYFENATKMFKHVAADGTPTIIAGDFNMQKEHYLTRWEAAGFKDCLNETWTTNKATVRGPKNTTSSIDYVLRSRSMNASKITCHRPVEVEGSNAHLPILFEIGEKAGSISSNGACNSLACMLNCTGMNVA